jgi:hypothetical protein
MTKITNKLLKEAIADAEAVRETAIANAKLALEESMGPQIKDMIARRLQAEAMNAEEMEDTPEVEKHEEEMEEAKELPFEDGEAEGSADMPADTSKIGTKPNMEPSADAFDSAETDHSNEAPADSDDDWYDDWDESDFDLGEVIKELENDIAALKAKDAENKEDDDVATDMAAEEPAKEEPAEAPEADKEETEEDEDELTLEQILAELDNDDEEEDEDDKEELVKEVARLNNELAQYQEAFTTVRTRLAEVNLLNAKLLFTNKMFRKDGLTNEQKVRIVESFDRATTVREVKLVYTALVENLSVAAKTITSRRKVMAEGVASKAIPSTAPKKEPIVENTVAKRLQELAGII